MNRTDNSGTGIAGLGRGEDSMLAHVAPGEMVVPPVISPQTQKIIEQEMMSAGLDPSEYTVGQGMSINPITGMAEFGFLKKLAKSVKKVVKKVAPIAAVIPGPWQAPAILYNKGRAVVNIAKGEGGLGDIMTVMAGGSQKVFGADGALKSVTSGDFLKAGGGFGDAFKAIGSVDGKFNPLQYGRNIGQTYMDDQKKGYFGLFGGDQQPMTEEVMYEDPSNPGEYLTQAQVDERIASGNFDQFNQVSQTSPGGFMNAVNTQTSSSPFNFGRMILGKGNTPEFIKGIEDSIKGPDGQLGGGDGSFMGVGSGGINPGLAAMAALYGKAVKEDFKRKEGGLKDIRQSVRPDLMPAPTFTGFDLGVRSAAKGGLQELDMRMGGPSIGPGTGTSDDIPAMLSDGEFVMTSAANNGLGGFKVTKTETGLELIPNGKPNRQKGAKNMDKLMKTFEQFNKVGMA
tara:strand:+ start:33815 stop:35179 length:1365 start_codon:yes stop_codon:yes gene_type:complete